MNEKLFSSTPRKLEVLVGVVCAICALFFVGLLLLIAIFVKRFEVGTFIGLTSIALLCWFFSLMAIRLFSFKAADRHKPLLPTVGLYIGAVIFIVQPIVALISLNYIMLLHSWFNVAASFACVTLAWRRRNRGQSADTIYIPPPIHLE